MKFLLENMQIKVNEKLYLKDPESSDLGKKIIEYSIKLIDEVGFEAFTFKKLGALIHSNESSIYRYFENKHKLLLYLTSWYWAWTEYNIVLNTFELVNPTEKLKKMIDIVTNDIELDDKFSHIDEIILNKILINEYSKSFLTKEVDQENKDGYFSIYKRLIIRIRDSIKEVNADYEYPTSLASTIIEGSMHQKFLKDHFPTITDCSTKVSASDYFNHLVFTQLKNSL